MAMSDVIKEFAYRNLPEIKDNGGREKFQVEVNPFGGNEWLVNVIPIPEDDFDDLPDFEFLVREDGCGGFEFEEVT